MSADSFSENEFKRLHEVEHFLEINRPERAENQLRMLLEQYPENGQLHYLMARCHIEADRLEEAVEATKDALAYGYRPESCFILLGAIYFDLQYYYESEEALLEALRENPQNAAVIAIYARLMLATGHENKARQLLKEALALDPDDPTVLEECFSFYLAQGNKEKQDVFLTQLHRSSGDQVSNLINTGLKDYFNDDYKSARENFRQAYLAAPENVALLGTLEEVDKESHWVFWAHRLTDKLGGPVVIWISAVIISFVLRGLKLYTPLLIFAVIYLSFCAYTWITPLLYRLFFKGK